MELEDKLKEIGELGMVLGEGGAGNVIAELGALAFATGKTIEHYKNLNE